LLNPAHGRLLARLIGHTAGITGLAWSPDGKTLASCSSDKTILLWDRNGKRRFRLRGHTDLISCLAWNPTGKLLATGSGDEDKSVFLWNTITGQRQAILRGHTRQITALAWRPDGKMLAVASLDGRVRIWNVKRATVLTTFFFIQ